MSETLCNSTSVRLWDSTIDKIDNFTIPAGPANQSRQQKADWLIDRAIELSLKDSSPRMGDSNGE